VGHILYFTTAPNVASKEKIKLYTMIISMPLSNYRAKITSGKSHKEKTPRLIAVFFLCGFYKLIYYFLSVKASRVFSRIRAATSCPPSPNAKPNAKASATTTPVNSV